MSNEIQKDFLKKLGKQIKKIRTERGLTQTALAHLCGKDSQSLQRVESGNTNPTAWYLQHIAVALNVEVKELFDTDLPKPKV